MPESQVKERAAKAQPMVKQVKILRDADKAGTDGQAASKGLGFVELVEHEHALCALRQLNNNPVPFGARPLPPTTCRCPPPFCGMYTCHPRGDCCCSPYRAAVLPFFHKRSIFANVFYDV